MATQAGSEITMNHIVQDHRELSEYYTQIKNAIDEKKKVEWQNQFTWELARHSIAEELVVYPAMEKYLGDKGKELAEKDRKEHRGLKEALNEFQKLSPSDLNFMPVLEQLYKDLDQHTREEEDDDLPTLEKAFPESEFQKVAKSFERTKNVVPTRSHPSAPDRPPFETVAGLLAAPMDKLSDMFRKFLGPRA